MQASNLSSDNIENNILNENETASSNNWGVRLKSSNFHLGLDLQTKYMWRGMEMMTEESSPVVFPCINYQWKGLYAYAMGGYAINGKYAEVDLGVSYTWKGLTLGLSDYYYPTVNGKDDEYVGGKHNGHWLEACITYAPEKFHFGLLSVTSLLVMMMRMMMTREIRSRHILHIWK